MEPLCEYCQFYEYDDEDEGYFCSVCMDEDDYVRLLADERYACPYFVNGDEYLMVRHQM